MTIATVLAAGLLPVIPQPTQWMPAEGECDLATASVSVAVCADQTWEQFAALADAKREPEGVKSSHKTTLSK